MADYCTVEVKFFQKVCNDDALNESNKLAFKNFANVFTNFKKDNKFFYLKSLINDYFKEHFHAISDNRHAIVYLDINESEIIMDVDMAYDSEDIKVFYDIIQRYGNGSSIDFVYTCYGNGYHITTDPEGPLYHIYWQAEEGNWWDEPIYEDTSILKFLEDEKYLKINDIAFRLSLLQLEKEKKIILFENRLNAYLEKMYPDCDFYGVEIHKYTNEEGRYIVDSL